MDIGIVVITLVCLVGSNISTWRIARRRGISDALTALEDAGFIELEEE